MNPLIEIRVTRRSCYDTETQDYREVVTYRPVLNLERFPCASGEITFAIYEAWADEDHATHIAQRTRAVENAFTTLKLIADEADSECKDQ